MAKREDALLKLMSRSLYGEKVHYALELIQNAEDACSSSITFIFERDRIVVINDGEVFEPYDVDAICSVKPGRKKNKIGFFGIGFKSVFNVTSRPQVISSDFNFFVENFIYTSSADDMPECAKEYSLKEKGSIFVLPQSDELPTIPDLIDNFREIDDKILLFLSSLKSLHFIDRINDESWSIEKPEAENNLIRLVDGREDTETSWIVFHRDLSVKPPIRAPRSIVIFQPRKEATCHFWFRQILFRQWAGATYKKLDGTIGSFLALVSWRRTRLKD
jgi:hypothetical protein